MLYLPGALSECVDLERCIAGVQEHPEPPFQVKANVQRTVRQGEPAVRYELLFIHLVQNEELNR